MMLFKLSLKNIKKSFKDYAIYFFTLILGVSIFYVFNAIESQTVLINITSSTAELIKLMTNLLSGFSVFVAFVLGFLVIYASRFLMKRRNKEFGIYMTLGLNKKKISKILVIETFLIGILSLFIGLLFGVLLSQLMSLFVANLFEADMTKFTFIFSWPSAKKTILYFGIMYILVMIFNTFSVGKCKLIDLLYKHKKSETIKLKNPITCILVFILSVIALGYAYYKVTLGVNTLVTPDKIFLPITLGVVSTFGIFWSLSGLTLKIVKSIRGLYYKDLNSFILRQISSKVNTTVFSMTIICLMLFFTICILSSSLSLKNSMTANLKELVPVDIEFSKKRNLKEELEGPYTKEEIIDSKYTIKQTLEHLGFDYKNELKDMLEVTLYATEEITMNETFGDYLEELKKNSPYLQTDTKELFMKESDYNKVAKVLHLEEIHLDKNEYIIVADYEQWIQFRNEALKRDTKITLLGKTYSPKYKTCVNGFIEMAANHINLGIFVVPDDALEESMSEMNLLYANYKKEKKEEKRRTEEKIATLRSKDDKKITTLSAATKISIYEASIGLGAMVTFIGLYLGIIFLISSAAILALKELSESTDNIERYQMLRKIGVEEKMINRALFRQIGIFFFVPLLLAIIHSIFGIIFCNYILATFGEGALLKSIIMTAIFLILIYGGYFLLTYFCSKNIIKESR